MAAWSRCTTCLPNRRPSTCRTTWLERAQAKIKEVRQVLGDAEPAYSTGQEIALGGYGFRWLRLD